VFVAGQGPFAPDGSLIGGDFEVRHTLDNLGTVLEQSGASFADVVKLTVFLTDITRLPVYGRVKAGYITGQQPASTAVQVQALALPGMQIEIEAIAVSREPE
jgi:enamine deaminase RidA (YjgF/YER057c/UK114 family)